ncbi:hypothetical protein VU07_04095 [Desulfobulbus sp. F4]|nr:hypothetical protein [Desulfobulbus sp. F4]
MTTEQINKPSSLSAIDPGSLMLAAYVFAVSALVLIGWLGSAGANGEINAALEPPGTPVAVIQR